MKKWMLLMVFAVGLAGSGWGQARVDSASVDSLFVQAGVFLQTGDVAQAVSILDTILIKTENPSVQYARALKGKGQCFRQLGDYHAAEQLFMDCKEMWETSLDTTQSGYTDILNDLGVLYNEMGKYEYADKNYRKCLKIRERLFGKFHPLYATALNNFATNCLEMGQYDVAEKYYKEGITIRDSLFGRGSKESSRVMLGLGSLYFTMGHYEDAEDAFRRRLTTLQNLSMTASSDYAEGLLNLGAAFHELGRWKEAEGIYWESKKIVEDLYGKGSPASYKVVSNLALLYKNKGDPIEAEHLLLECKKIIEQAIGTENADYAQILDNLATLYSGIGRYAEAEGLFAECNTIREKVIGKGHLDYAQGLNNLAEMLDKVNRGEEAASHYWQAKAIFEANGNDQSLHYAQILNNLAISFANLKRFDQSDPLLRQSAPILRAQLVRAAKSLSEKEIGRFAEIFEDDISIYLWQSQAHTDFKREISKITYDNALFYKGFLLQAAAAVRNRALADTTIAKTWHLLASNHRRLAKEYSKPIAERDSTNIVSIEQQVNDLEKILVRRVAGFGGAYQPVLWENVQARLRPGEAAVEFVHFRKSFPRPTDSIFYAALLLRPGWPQPRFIPLFEERAWAANFDCPGIGETGCATRRYSPQSAYPLYPLVWQPLDSLLTGAKTVFFAPSGQLHLLNFGAIGIGHDSILSQKYRLVQVGSTRQLMSRDSVFSEKTQPAAILFGGVRYDTNTVAIRAENAKLDTHSVFRTRGAAELPFSLTDSTLRAGAFNYLQGTANEVQNIRPTIQNRGIAVHTFTGFGATEEAFKHIGTTAPPPRILHLATHGFFFPAVKDEQEIGRNREPVFKISDHPMIRSGLVLAGGNYGWHTSKPASPDLEDGILTAYEISQTNLRGTELVVLSACQTGLGDLHTNEGVYGLQRAFKIAGARYLVMSLWKVPDRATQELMTLLYQKWLSENLPLPDAFRATQAAMREKYPDEPLNWAGWVLVE